MYYGRQLFEEMQHIEAYLLLLDNYVSDDNEKNEMFKAIETIPSIKAKADFCFKWIATMSKIKKCDTDEQKKAFLMNVVTFAAAIEGLFFFGAFSYVYYLRSKGLLHGLGSITNWIFRDETGHMNFAFELVDVIKQEYPHLWDDDIKQQVLDMLEDAIQAELQFSEDVLELGIAGLSKSEMKEYLEYVADLRLVRLGMEKKYNSKNPFPFMILQDMAENTNFFERTVVAYQKGVSGEVKFDEDF
jgi:ribonucleoside-diphosphate reductase beta chain